MGASGRLRRALRVGVPEQLLELPAVGGHGRVWSRVLGVLRSQVKIVPVRSSSALGSRSLRRPEVLLASGHADLPERDVPLVVQVHEAGWFDPELRALLAPAFLDHIAPRTERAVRAAEEVITPSEAARREVISSYGLDPSRVHAIPHGVDPIFRPGLGGGRELVARVCGDPAVRYVLYAASIHPRKNLAALRDAMARLAAQGLPHVLVIAGMDAPDRPDSEELERAAAAELPGLAGRVVRLGTLNDEDLAALMAGADAFCLPSLHEGFGLTALEAMACGAPVVVSDRGALPEVVGDAGVIVPPTADGLARALAALLGDAPRARRLGDAAASRARAFTWERTAGGWLEVLRAAAAQAYTRRRR